MDIQAILAQKDAQIAELTALHQASEKTVRELREKVILFQDQLAQLQRMIYGRKSERFVPNVEDYPNLFSQIAPDSPEAFMLVAKVTF